ncbi:MAG: hypothetical protein FJ014_19290 [Chloroflexi bacterium]|nr:hypothetical protein [Chloroflexota bacterium]
MDKKSLRSGYNFVERNMLGNKIEDIEATISIIAFLRLLQRGEIPPRQVKVDGLDRLLLRMQDRDSSRFLRRLLSEASDALMKSGAVVLFPVARIGQNLHPKLVLDGQDVQFYHIFSKGLRQEDVGYFRCPFTIS